MHTNPTSHGAPRIAPGTVADAEEIASLGARVFHDTFVATVRPADMKAFLGEVYTPTRLAGELANPALVFFLARANETLAGFVQMRQGPAHASVRGPLPVQLQRLYIDPRWHGAGVAQALVSKALAWAIAAGYQTLWLGVDDTNQRAKRFYEKLGMTVCGSHLFQVGSDAQVDLVMEAPIARAQAN